MIKRARSTYLIVGVVVPLVVAASSVIAQLVWLPELPDPAAIHFSGSGPDGFGPAWTYPLITAIICVVMVAMNIAVTAQHSARQTWSPTLPALSAIVGGAVVMLAPALAVTVYSQRGLADARDATDPGFAILVCAVIGVAYAVVAWFAQPKLTVDSATDEPPVAHRVAPGEQVAWVQTLRMSPGITAVLLITMALCSTVMLVSAMNGTAAMWPALITLLVIAIASLTLFAYRARVDASGLTVRSVIGIPRFHIPLEDIADVRAVDVSPLSDFGGWGIRGVPGNVGIVLRAGSALQIERTNGKRFTVTTDDADRAAALLIGLRDRARG